MDSSDKTKPQNPGSYQPETTGKAEEAKEAAKDVAQDVKAQGQELAKETVAQAKQSLSQVREQAMTALSEAQNQVAEHGLSLARSFDKTSEHLRGEDESELADVSEKLSAQVQRASDYLRGKDISSLLHDTAQLARRRPELVLGGAVLLGMLGGRFLKSSGRARR
jgi:hypothetical protein